MPQNLTPVGGRRSSVMGSKNTSSISTHRLLQGWAMRRWGTRLIQSLETQFVIEQLASLSACQSSFKTSMGIRRHGKCKFDPKNKVSVCVFAGHSEKI